MKKIILTIALFVVLTSSVFAINWRQAYDFSGNGIINEWYYDADTTAPAKPTSEVVAQISEEAEGFGFELESTSTFTVSEAQLSDSALLDTVLVLSRYEKYVVENWFLGSTHTIIKMYFVNDGEKIYCFEYTKRSM